MSFPQTNFTLNSVFVLKEHRLFYDMCAQKGEAAWSRASGMSRFWTPNKISDS